MGEREKKNQLGISTKIVLIIVKHATILNIDSDPRGFGSANVLQSNG